MKGSSWNTMRLRIRGAHKTYCDPDWHWRHVGSDEALFNLWLVVAGKGTMRVAGKEFPLRAGDCFFFRQWEPNEGICESNSPLVVPYIVFTWVTPSGRARAAKSCTFPLPPLYRNILHQVFFETLLQRSIDAYLMGNHETAIHWLRTAILEMVRQDELPARTDFEHDQLEMVERIALDVYRSPLEFGNVDLLAERAGYSKDHFIRLFRKYKGVTPGEMIIQARIQSAGELLRFSNQSITQIAERLGYSDIYAFSKQFRQRMGQSPTSYRQSTTPGN